MAELNKKDGVTFFLTTQYLEEADRLADEVAIMDAGRIVAQGSPADLKASIGADVITVRIEGDAEAVDRATQAVRKAPGVQDVRALDSSVVIYIRDGSTAISRIVLLLDAASVGVGEISLARPTLDDVFIRKTGRQMKLAAEMGSTTGESA